ncbi:MAG: hypothetical protein AVDCRST_MAG64-2089 [uncultured Phycisphaerae bacterium]|uniref:DUF3179 domain-containing protein n=1 Tax=uncultured Phycisphaerae bacterium TaxID=904963 RepID=A0A6J4P5Z6_9BACT|nr:MAG: hypothetical protein AVDCRST_MAG64-2089 [uncultured Phycisphaerae bacterium]
MRAFADTFGTVRLPVLLLLFAVLAAAVMAYGTHPAWAQFPNGLAFILLARRMQWPMVALALVLCLVLLALVISGRRRAWWLIGLGPVLALFVHRFASNPANDFACVENPTFALASDATHVADGDWVVTLQFGDGHYAYPYAALYEAPVVIHAEHDKRVAVMWSAYANRAIAVPVGRELRAADLTVVGTPANMLIVYNGRLGEFINGVTGRTPDGRKPGGVGEPLATAGKTTWRAWRDRHPDGKVLLPVGAKYATSPRVPIRPVYPLPAAYRLLPGDGYVLVGAKQPLAIPTSAVTAEPLNVKADGVAALVFRDPADGAVRGFERRVGDLVPQFRANREPRRRPEALFVDADTGAEWSAEGVAVAGPAGIRGKRLPRLAVDHDLHFGIMSFAFGGISSYEGAAGSAAPATVPAR